MGTEVTAIGETQTQRDQLLRVIEANAELLNWLVHEGIASTVDTIAGALPIPMARKTIYRLMISYARKKVGEETGEEVTDDDLWRFAPLLIGAIPDEHMATIQDILLMSVSDGALVNETLSRGLAKSEEG